MLSGVVSSVHYQPPGFLPNSTPIKIFQMTTPLLPPSDQTSKTSTMENLTDKISKLANSHSQTPLTPSQIALLQKKLLLAFPVFQTPTHPTYAVMIENAINKLDEVDGSSEESISKYIKANYDGLPWAHATYLSHHLKKLCGDGEIVLDSTSKCYRIPARAVVKDYKTPEKQPTTRVCLRRKRNVCGVGQVEKRENNVLAASENLIGLQGKGTMMTEKSKTKGRRRCLVLEDDDSEVGGKTNVGDGEQNKLVVQRPQLPDEAVAVRNGDDLLKEGNEHGIVTAIENDPSIIGILDKISKCEVTANRENVDEDNISATEMMGIPVKSEKSFSTLSSGINDSELIVEDLDLKEPKLMNVPFEENTGISAASSGINEFAKCPNIVCCLEEPSKHSLVWKFLDRKTTKKERPKVRQAHKKVSSESMTSSSALAVGHNLLEHDQIHDRLLSQRELETKESPHFEEFEELPVDQHQEVCGIEGNYVEQLERADYSENPESPLSEQYLQNLEHHREDQKRQDCENNSRFEDLEAPPVGPFAEENQPISYSNCDPVLKIKLQERPQDKFASKEYSEPLVPHNINQNNKERKTCGLVSHRIQLKKSGEGKLWKYMEVTEEDITPSRVRHPPQESSELVTRENSLQQVQQVKHLMKKGHKKLKKSPESPFVQQITLEKEDWKLLGKSMEATKEDLIASTHLYLQDNKPFGKVGRGRPRKKKQVKEDSTSQSVILNVARELEKGLPDQEKEHKDKVWEQSELITQNLGNGSYKGGAGLPKKNGRGRPRKNKDQTASKNLDLQEIKQAKKGRGRPRKHKQVNNKDPVGLFDKLIVVHKLEEGPPNQENELQDEQVKTAQKPNLSNGSRVEPDKSQSEIRICETQLAVPPSDIDEKDNKQEEVEFEDEAELPKVESEKAIMSLTYPLRSRVNQQSHVSLSSKDQLRSRINSPSQ